MDASREFQRRVIPFTAIVAIALLILVLALQPARTPPPIGSANGVYRNPCCAPVTLRDGVMFSSGQRAGYMLENGKYGLDVIVPAGLGVHGSAVKFGGNMTRASLYGDNSVDQTGVMRLVSLDDSQERLFTKG